MQVDHLTAIELCELIQRKALVQMQGNSGEEDKGLTSLRNIDIHELATQAIDRLKHETTAGTGWPGSGGT